ncbi:MAG: hypothetical protein R3B99_08665 [Polyangiales bacterium]
MTNHTMGWLLLCLRRSAGAPTRTAKEFERFMREGEAQANAAVEAAAAPPPTPAAIASPR